MSKVFKIINEFDKINQKILFEINNALVTRGNGMKSKVKRYNTIARKSYFNVVVVDHWNRLLASVIIYKTIDSFKSKLNKYFRETCLLYTCVYLDHHKIKTAINLDKGN